MVVVYVTGISLCNYICCNKCHLVFVTVIVVWLFPVIVELIMLYVFLAVELLCRTLDRSLGFKSADSEGSNCVLDTKPMEVISLLPSKCGNSTVRPSPNHGTLRLRIDDGDCRARHGEGARLVEIAAIWNR